MVIKRIATFLIAMFRIEINLIKEQPISQRATNYDVTMPDDDAYDLLSR